VSSADDTLRAGIFGVLVGDALGVPYEFKRAEDIGEVPAGACMDDCDAAGLADGGKTDRRIRIEHHDDLDG